MNYLSKIGFGLFGISLGLFVAKTKYSKELEEILKERGGLIEEQISLIDEYQKLMKENIEVRDTVIETQAEIIERLDPDIAAKIKRMESIKLVK